MKTKCHETKNLDENICKTVIDKKDKMIRNICMYMDQVFYTWYILSFAITSFNFILGSKVL